MDPESRTPSGKLQVKKFTTPPPSPADQGISLGFMLKDTDDCLYFYTKPTKQGKLCLDTYFVDAVPADIIDSKEYEGDLSKYVTEWLKKKKADEAIDYYLHYDISRSECRIVDRAKEGKVYIIFGGPLDGNGGERFNFLRFPYKKGMETHKYVHSIGEQTIY